MTVWHITKSLDGGAGRYASRLSSALREKGIKSIVLAANGEREGLESGLTRSCGNVTQFFSKVQRSFVRRISKEPFHLMSGFERYHVTHDLEQPGIVHLHGMTGWIGFEGVNQLIPPGAVVFQTTHSPFDYSGGCVLRAGASCQQFKHGCHRCPILKVPMRWMSHRELGKKAKWVRERRVQPVANSQWMADRVSESPVFDYARGVPIVPPIVADIFFSQERIDLRDELKVRAGRKVICLGAQVVTDKGKGICDFFIHLASFHRLLVEVTFVIFGEGECSVPEWADVRFFGELRDPAMLAGLFDLSDVFVSPSSMETFGMTLAEAQAAGCAVVGFNVGGIEDAVYPQHHHRLVAGGDWEALFRCLEETLFAEAGHEEMLAASRWIEGQFGAEAVAKKQIKIYSKASRVKLSGERF